MARNNDAGRKVKLALIDPGTRPVEDKSAGEQLIRGHAARINKLQDRLYAEAKRAVLVVLQGTDTSGKDGTIRAVFNDTGPIGVTVTPFRAPSAEELAHDYLWRAHLAAPRRGTIGIFNRSHYEDVLVVKVKGLVPAAEIEKRYEQINQFEKMLNENRTTILKFMLHISKEEQGQRLKDRLAEPDKRWKFNPGDLEDRKLWDEYQEAYEIMVNRCSTPWAPWHVIPADRKWARNLAVARIVREKLEEMNPQYPVPAWKAGDFRIE
jgi:PPK2 family polyphosphate:nucleotide phosphotransferase